MLALLATLLAGPPQVQGADSALAVVIEAGRAMAGDSIARVEARWRRRTRLNPRDRLAWLALGALATSRYAQDEVTRHAATVLRLGDGDATAARSRLLLAGAHTAGARYAAADTALQLAAATARSAADSMSLVEALTALAVNRLRTHGSTHADSLLRSATEAVSPRQKRAAAIVRCARALMFSARSQPEARAEALAAAALAREAGEERLRGNCLMVVAQDLVRRGRGDSAARIFSDILRAQQAIRDRAGAAVTLQWRGYVLRLLGNYPWALADLQSAVTEGTAIGTPVPVAWASLSLADIALAFGDVEEAAQHAARARDMFLRSGDRSGAAGVTGTLGDIARAKGDVVTARGYYEEALRWAEGARNAVQQVALTHGLADLAMIEGDWSVAASHLATGERLIREHRMQGWEGPNRIQRSLLAVRIGNAREAVQLLNGLEGNYQSGRAYVPRVTLAEAQARLGNVSEAEAQLTLALDEVDRWRNGLSDQDLRLSVFEPKVLWFDPDLGAATVLDAMVRAGRVHAAFGLAERARARVLFERLAQEQALRTPGADSVIYTQAAIRTIRRTMTTSGQASVAELQAALPEATALLEYVTGRTNEPTTLFVLTRDSVRAFRLPTIDSLAPHVARLVRYAQGGVESAALERALGDALLGSALGTLPQSVTRLVIVGSDVLLRLPFDVLRVGSQSPLVERYAISSAPSAAVARALWDRDRRSTPGTVVAFGDPVFPVGGGLRQGPASRAIGPGGFARLPGTRDEVRAIARLFPDVLVRERRGASESFLRSHDWRQVAILHVGTHAWVDDRSIKYTAIALAPDELADGYVIPSELSELNLDTDVVVLSACSTASGAEIRGEGLVGLTNPLLGAGARSVVATRWRIDDTAATVVVRTFYDGIARGLSVADALQRAKLTARASGVGATAWAAFDVIGNGNVRPNVAPRAR